MPLDQNYLQQLLAKDTTDRLIRTRVSNSDVNEARANIQAARILNSNPIEIQRLEEEYAAERGITEDELQRDYDDDGDESETNNRPDGWEQPPSHESGLFHTDITPDESQIAAVERLVESQYGCLIGAAGSGKTTTTKILVHKLLYNENEEREPIRVRWLEGKMGPSIAFVAFTGIATQVIKQNMPEWLHPAVKTIHSLLEFAPVDTRIADKKTGEMKETTVFMPMRDSYNKLKHDLIIIDEASMVGVDLWHQLLDALRPGTRIILIGDLNQLPPVVSQSMFAYVLAAWPVSELTKIHRQKEPAANRIIECAHAILQGEKFAFDDPKTNVNWRVIGLELNADPVKAGVQIVALANQLRSKRVDKSVDPDEPLIYDPYRDRIITAGNGYNDNDPASAVEQVIINDALSRLIEPPTGEHPRIVIDAGRMRKVFAVNHRVMATRNEPPDVPNRVTNGMVGIIREIEMNNAWGGDWNTVGSEQQVEEARRMLMTNLFKNSGSVLGMNTDGIGTRRSAIDDEFEEGMTLDDSDVGKLGKNGREGGGPASHSVTVEFVNGATRRFTSKNQVESLFLAYASTCHKCQGSQMDTAIIVCHHAKKGMLSREWLYTAITRATKRVVFLYTDFGLRSAISKQKIFGKTLEEKIYRYKLLQEETLGGLEKLVGIKNAKVRLSIEGDDFEKREEVA